MLTKESRVGNPYPIWLARRAEHTGQAGRVENTKSTTLVKPPSDMALAQDAHISAGTSRPSRRSSSDTVWT